ncbi:hypothetical protein ABO04_08375 [Nitrosomonas sp. HPC101]|nr:hypothetical protein [Nitrosomonas sp. HPC101]
MRHIYCLSLLVGAHGAPYGSPAVSSLCANIILSQPIFRECGDIKNSVSDQFCSQQHQCFLGCLEILSIEPEVCFESAFKGMLYEENPAIT